MSDYQQRPPIGLVPRQIYEDLRDYQRLQDIGAAISRYLAVGKDIPPEWLHEHEELKVKLIESGYLQPEYPFNYNK